MTTDLSGKPSTCRKCGDPVLTFHDHDLPITATLAALARDYRIWQYLGPRVGWVNKPLTERTWRPIRASHRCPGDNRAELGATSVSTTKGTPT